MNCTTSWTHWDFRSFLDHHCRGRRGFCWCHDCWGWLGTTWRPAHHIRRILWHETFSPNSFVRFHTRFARFRSFSDPTRILVVEALNSLAPFLVCLTPGLNRQLSGVASKDDVFDLWPPSETGRNTILLRVWLGRHLADGGGKRGQVVRVQHSTVEGTYLGDLEVKKEQIRNIVRAHKVCATLKNCCCH